MTKYIKGAEKAMRKDDDADDDDDDEEPDKRLANGLVWTSHSVTFPDNE